ncbi:hypothetical protein FPCIR_10168 [Fusarium pseudocircinatum]|uniref:AB hydrolase-1 domain-containing protein n=1 Tax=Fusarium pseudocircinatum TaxID=56676 RepID=A0A8H5NW10_9HYPO|nr:hypothetical protein FPCIR_10168 [Fusarium pseudocircinatum]
MEHFDISLQNGEQVTGIHCLPPRSESPLSSRPLIVALHGGGYDCHYFDADSKHTAAISANAYGVPFVSIDRPCYGGSTSFLPVPADSDFVMETSVRLHKYILPALWAEFGNPNECNGIVLFGHSLGSMFTIATAAMHAKDESPSYVLSGIIYSGLGDIWQPHMTENFLKMPLDPMGHALNSPKQKDATMFRSNTVHPNILKLTEQLDAPIPLAEIQSLPESWLPSWKEKWAAHIRVPVMCALAEQEPFFIVSKERLQGCTESFSTSVRVDGSFILGAPHCMELSLWAQGWYARVFGFAVECSVQREWQTASK